MLFITQIKEDYNKNMVANVILWLLLLLLLLLLLILHYIREISSFV